MTRRGQQKNEKYSGIAKQIYFVSQTEERRNGNKWFALLIKNNKIFRELSFLVFDILKASSKLLYCIRHPVWMRLLKVLSPKRKFYFRKNNVKLKQERNHFVLKDCLKINYLMQAVQQKSFLANIEFRVFQFSSCKGTFIWYNRT